MTPSALREPALFLAALSWTAAATHAVVAVPHFDEYVTYGVLFALLAVFQVLWGVAVYRRPQPGLLMAGIVLTAGVIAVWIVSRTVGLPIGPDPGSPEPVGLADVGATLDECALIALAGRMVLAAPGRGGRSGLSWDGARALRTWQRQVLLGVLVFAGVAALAAGHSH